MSKDDQHEPLEKLVKSCNLMRLHTHTPVWLLMVEALIEDAICCAWGRDSVLLAYLALLLLLLFFWYLVCCCFCAFFFLVLHYGLLLSWHLISRGRCATRSSSSKL